MNTKNIFILISALLIFTSCEKVIDLTLPENEAKVVIEAQISNATPINTVRLSKTVNYNQPNIFPPVTGAIVTIADNAGNSETLTEQSQGYYLTSQMIGVIGRTYTLTVTAEGQTYTAQCTMPVEVPFDSLIFSREKQFAAPDSLDVITPIYTDPIAIANYYRYVRVVNQKRFPGSWYNDDIFTDGETNTFGFYADDMELQPGDTLTVEMQSIAKVVYQYFNSKAQSADGFTGAPANPVTNITGGALGYFSAHTSQVRAVVVPQ